MNPWLVCMQPKDLIVSLTPLQIANTSEELEESAALPFPFVPSPVHFTWGQWPCVQLLMTWSWVTSSGTGIRGSGWGNVILWGELEQGLENFDCHDCEGATGIEREGNRHW